MCEVDLKGEELWEPKELGIPVYHIDNGMKPLVNHFRQILLKYHALGSDLRTLKTSLTCSLCDQIFTSPTHWAKATEFPSTAMHAIDFGPGGLSGIGSLTARDLEGRGIRVIVIGEKEKGGAEVIDSSTIKRETAWGAKHKPQLAKTS
jgi:fatty acid synthase subunit alpha